VIASTPAEADAMRAALGRSVLEAREHGGASEQIGMDPATKARLKARLHPGVKERCRVSW